MKVHFTLVNRFKLNFVREMLKSVLQFPYNQSNGAEVVKDSSI